MSSDDDEPISRRLSKKRIQDDSEDDKPIIDRVQRRASVASRAGIKRSIKEESESGSDESGEDMGSEDSDSDDSASENSDDGDSRQSRRVVKKPAAKKVVKAIPKKKATTPSKKVSAPKLKTKSPASAKKRKVESSESEAESEDDAAATSNKNEVKVLKQVQNRTLKEQLVAGILCRWWYVMPEWPPAGYDYPSRLAGANLRTVPLDRWEDEPDHDKAGRLKCYALSQYPGLFRDATGKLNDMRPIEGKPCFSELIRKSEKELQNMMAEALGKQLEILSASPEKNTGPIIADLKEKLKNVRKK